MLALMVATSEPTEFLAQAVRRILAAASAIDSARLNRSTKGRQVHTPPPHLLMPIVAPLGRQLLPCVARDTLLTLPKRR